jgi:putative ABC transport system substrate-binding protein
MKRREAVLGVILPLVLLAVPVPSDAQRPAKVYRIGYLVTSFGSAELNPQNCPIAGSPLWRACVEGLREHGYVQGQNLVIECRNTGGRDERAPAVAAELVRLTPDLIVAVGTAQTQAVKQATNEIPVVMVGVWHPVERKLVTSLARPGGNITGVADTAGDEVEGKHLQFLKEAVPTASRVAVLYHAPSPAPFLPGALQETAQALHVTFQPYAVREPEDFAGAFAAMAKAKAEALLVRSHPFINTNRRRVIDLAAQNRLPALYPWKEAAAGGGLMGYGVDLADNFRRVGGYVDRIFKGAKPGDLPVWQPTKFDLVINLKTAKALGLTIPSSLLMRADEVIQ